MRCLIPLLLSAVSAHAMGPRPADTPLDAQGMSEHVIGQTHEFFDGDRSFFSISGTYTYTYADGGVAYGHWEMPAGGTDGVICTFFRHGFSRCDRYVQNKGRILLITEEGTRFPVRANSAD